MEERSGAYRFARAVLLPPMAALTKRQWRGMEHLPKTGGVVVATNHLSHADPLTLAHFIDAAGRVPRFLAKSDLFEAPVIGSIVRGAGQIPVYRETADAVEALRMAVAAVRSGECVVVYPEGTLTRDPGLWPMVGKTGAARIGLMTGAPVVPVAQWGPQHLLAPYHRFPTLLPRHLVQVWAGSPVDLDDLRDRELTREVLHEATGRVMNAIVGMLEIMRGEKAPPTRFDPKAAQVPLTGDPRRQPSSDKRSSNPGKQASS